MSKVKKIKKEQSRGMQLLKNMFNQHDMPDLRIIIVTLVLFIIGVIMVSNVESVRLGAREIFMQNALGALGIVIMVVFAFCNYNIFNGYFTFAIYYVCLALSVMAAASGGGSGISRGLGSIQPSEMLKTATILMLSLLLCSYSNIFEYRQARDAQKNPLYVKRRRTLGECLAGAQKSDRMPLYRPRFREPDKLRKMIFCYLPAFTRRGPVLALVTLIAVAFLSLLAIFFQSHLSALIIVLVMSYLMLLIGIDNKYIRYALIILGILAFAAALIVVINPEIFKHIPGVKQYQYERIALWRYKLTEQECLERNFMSNRTQTEASLRAIGSGGWFGRGFGQSLQKYNYLAAAHTDFIFSVFIEEFGYIGGIVVLALFAYLIFLCLRVASTAANMFGSLVATGISLHLALQVVFNVAVVTDLLPNTGITLPFFSYGGTAIVMLFAEMGIVLSISKSSGTTKSFYSRIFDNKKRKKKKAEA